MSTFSMEYGAYTIQYDVVGLTIHIHTLASGHPCVPAICMWNRECLYVCVCLCVRACVTVKFINQSNYFNKDSFVKNHRAYQ